MGYSHSAKSPTGGVAMRRAPTQPALQECLMRRVVDRFNLLRAWEQVKDNRGAPGVDGMTVDEFPSFAREHWAAIRQALLDGTYLSLSSQSTSLIPDTSVEGCGARHPGLSHTVWVFLFRALRLL